MTLAQTPEPISRKPLRLWPGVVLVILQWLIRFVVPVVKPDAMPYAVMGGLAFGLAVLVWWLFFSRAPWADRLGFLALMIAGVVAARPILDPSISTGAMGMLFYVLVVPGLCLALVAGAALGRRLSDGPRRAVMAAAILLACGVWALARTGGFTAGFDNDFAWRWTPTPEEQLLAQAGDEPVPPPPVPAAAKAPAESLPAQAAEEPATEKAPEPAEAPAEAPAAPAAPARVEAEAEWPGFRGPRRDGIVRGVRIATDWSASPPVELWRRPVGPGWSSFAVQGDLFYTQEQRGEDEVVACYSRTTGEPVWMHRDAARFWESNAGAGPRGTPTLSNGRIYTLGATGILNALDARTGGVIWSRNAAADTGTETPVWGFSSSPLVIGNVIVVATAGKLAAYDIATGEPRWYGPAGGDGYSSPHLATIGGVPQILLLSGSGAASVAPADGKLLWEHPSRVGTRIVQPALTADGDVLISAGDGMGRFAVAHGPGGWNVKERWTSNGLKPYFNDFVVHDGHAYGIDGNMIACIGLQDGKRKWKGGRYGSGQLVLLPEQDLLLVISEKGELALVKASPDGFTELARFPAIEGKTWNHPVLIGDVLLVRNDQEMAAFRLPLAGAGEVSQGR